ncbi:MAG: GTPase Era, partial [Deltaproteobacteria bacterium]|nr:GTPase Era [Deltaproteobacteria bacterium]
IPVSALKGDGIDDLLREIKSKLKQGPVFFPPGMDTDQSESFLVAEIIREKVYLHTREELPYSTAVSVDQIKEKPEKTLMSISARIHVESDSQKAILIGRKGGMIKAIGKSARLEIERLFGVRVFLELRVRVEKNWSRDPRALRRLGY